RPERQEPHPEQQRALLRRPRRGGAVERRRGGARVLGDHPDAEVRPQEGGLEDREGQGEESGERVYGPPPRERPAQPPATSPIERGADAVELDRERQDQQGRSQARHVKSSAWQ